MGRPSLAAQMWLAGGDARPTRHAPPKISPAKGRGKGTIFQTTDNAGFVNRDLLGHVKSSAFFINVARGGLVDEAALADALNAGQLAGAAVDVVSHEPMRADNPLLGARNCVITPHIAWASLAARRRLMATTVRNVEAFIAGRPINVVN